MAATELARSSATPHRSILHVLPASRVVCRVVETPPGSDADTTAALSLLAEATLPALLPPHRRAAGRLGGVGPVSSPAFPGATASGASLRAQSAVTGGVEPVSSPDPRRAPRGSADAPTPPSRSALLLGWPGDAPAPPIHAEQLTYTAEPVALQFLLSRLPGRFAVYADRAESSLCICLNTPPRPIVRALRESASSDEAWTSLVRDRIAQTLQSLTPEHSLALEGMLKVEDCDSPILLLDPETESALRETIEGLPDDPDWLRTHAVALAAALAALEAPASFRPLLSLSADAPRRRDPAALRAARWLAAPRHAAAVVAASAAAALLGPLALAAARHAVLDSRTGGLSALRESERRDSLRLAFADELERRRWPMTRLLAHLAGALPVGVALESVRIDTGQRAAIRGRADSLDLVNQLQSRLNNSGVFADASIDRTQSAGGAVEFDLAFRVVRPYAPPKGLDDFASLTLAQRLYGERATLGVSAPPRETSDSEPRTSQAASPRARAAPQPATLDIPPPISDADIAKLDAAAAMKEWTTRQRASKQPTLDAATRDRLTAESQKARERMLAARKEASQ